MTKQLSNKAGLAGNPGLNEMNRNTGSCWKALKVPQRNKEKFGVILCAVNL